MSQMYTYLCIQYTKRLQRNILEVWGTLHSVTFAVPVIQCTNERRKGVCARSWRVQFITVEKSGGQSLKQFIMVQPQSEHEDR